MILLEQANGKIIYLTTSSINYEQVNLSSGHVNINSIISSLILQYFSSIMTALKQFRRLVCQFDMFCSSELLRYHSQTQYKTLTGGLLSLVIISVVVGGFASMVGDTLNRVAITSSLVVSKQSDPPQALLKPGYDSMFMLALSIQSIDLSYLADLTNGPQYFSVGMYASKIEYGIPGGNPVFLQQCTRQHWNMMPEFVAGFDSFGVSGWLCLPLGSSLPIQGSYTSAVNQMIIIQVYPCKNSTYKNNCAPQQDIDAIFNLHSNFYLTLNYINPVINPNEQKFISYYTEANDYVIFSNQVGSQAWIYFSDYTINSDSSILPYEATSTTTGCIVESKAINHPYTVTENSPFVSVFLAKSANSLTYDRQVQKISAVFSYIGGLVGAITAVLFLVKSYTDTSLEVAIGLSLFEISEEQKKQDLNDADSQRQKDFNLFGFIRLTCYRILMFFGWKGKFQRAERLHKCQQEAIKQMDVQFLLRRVIKLQSCMSRLFTPSQLKEIKQGQAITFKSAKKMRMLLLKEEQQKQPQQHKSSKSDNLEKGAQMKEVIDQISQLDQKSDYQQSGYSIFKVKNDLFTGVSSPMQSPAYRIEQLKTFTRKAILKGKRTEENEMNVQWKNQVQNPSRIPIKNLSPIII